MSHVHKVIKTLQGIEYTLVQNRANSATISVLALRKDGKPNERGELVATHTLRTGRTTYHRWLDVPGEALEAIARYLGKGGE